MSRHHNPLADFKTRVLLRELIRRHGTTPAPYRIDLAEAYDECTIGIGPDHTACLLMDKGAMRILMGKKGKKA